MSKKSVITSFIILFIVLIGIVSYFIFINKLNNSPITTTETNVENASNWKSYKNDKYGFEMMFPPAWGDIAVEVEKGEHFNSEYISFNVSNSKWTIFSLEIVSEELWKSCEEDKKYVAEHPEEGY